MLLRLRLLLQGLGRERQLLMPLVMLVLLQGLPGDGGGAGYFGLAPGQRHPQMGENVSGQDPLRTGDAEFCQGRIYDQ